MRPPQARPLPRIVARLRDRTARIRLDDVELGKVGASRFDLRDPYYLVVGLRWPRVLLAIVGAILSINLVFALLYVARPGAIANAPAHSLAYAFFFSLETLATVGYGEMYPATLYGHVVASTEIVCGMIVTALLTGLVFVRFTRPKARFRYADQAVITQHNGRPTLMVRIANGRVSMLHDAVARLTVMLIDHTAEGQLYGSVHELALTRPRNPIFALTWTLMHDLDSASPLHGLDAPAMIERKARLFLTVEAHDPVLAATVRDMTSYAAPNIMFGMRYADAITISPTGSPLADLTRLSLLETDQGS